MRFWKPSWTNSNRIKGKDFFKRIWNASIAKLKGSQQMTQQFSDKGKIEAKYQAIKETELLENLKNNSEHIFSRYLPRKWNEDLKFKSNKNEPGSCVYHRKYEA